MRRCAISRAAREAARKTSKASANKSPRSCFGSGDNYPGRRRGVPAHMNWLMLQKLEHREQRIALEELLGAVRQESERVERLEQAIRVRGARVVPCRARTQPCR